MEEPVAVADPIETDGLVETPAEDVLIAEPSIDPNEPLLSIEEAVKRIPEGLRKEMEDLLRAQFREVQRWTPPKN